MAQANGWQDELYLTTNPPEILSVTTAFNAAVWTASGAIIGSYLQLPTLQGGEVNLSGLGAATGLSGYLGIMIYNKGIGGFIKGIEDGVVKETTKDTTEPLDTDKVKAFYDKYGVAWIDAVRRYAQEHPEDRVGKDFQDWLDTTYLHKPPSHGLTERQALDFYKYVLKRSTTPPLGPLEYQVWRDRELVDRWNDFKRMGWPGNNFWNWLKKYYNKE